jgi:hypothetical protein
MSIFTARYVFRPHLTGGAITWSAAHHGSETVLSNGALTATMGGSAASGDRSSGICDTAISGKIYCEYTIVQSTTNCGPGIVNASEVIANAAIFGDANGVSYLQGGGVWTNYNTYFGPFTTIGTFTTGSVVSLAVDTINGNFWLRVNGGSWNAGGGANPATNTGGYGLNSGTGGSFCTLGTGPYYAAYTVEYDGTNYSSITANFGATSYAYTAPAGFGNI